MTASLLTPDAELTPAEWLRRYALTRMKYGGEERERLLEVANLLQQTELTRDALAAHLDVIARVIKGPAADGCAWGFDDLPELVRQLMIDAKRPMPIYTGDQIGVH